MPSRHVEYVLHTYMYIRNREVKIKMPRRADTERERERERKRKKRKTSENLISQCEKSQSTMKQMVKDKEKKYREKNGKYIYTHISRAWISYRNGRVKKKRE